MFERGKIRIFSIIKGERDVMDAREIDSWIEHIWLRAVKKEYDQSRILEESNLHSTVYFHLRKLIESSKNKKPFIYSEIPFSTTMRGEGKKNPRVDLAVVILGEEKEVPIDLLAVIEVKYYYSHANSIGINKDLDHLKALRKGIYYPYAKSPTKLKARRAYFLYLVDEGEIIFDPKLKGKIERLRENGHLKVFLGFGDKDEFITSIENQGG
jgi:hypothetical protein